MAADKPAHNRRETVSGMATVEHTAEEKLAVLGRMTMVVELGGSSGG